MRAGKQFIRPHPILLSIQPLWLCAMAFGSQRTQEKDGKGDARLRLLIV